MDSVKEVVKSVLYFPYTNPWLWTIFSVSLSLGYIVQKRIFKKRDTFWEDQGVPTAKYKFSHFGSLFRLIIKGDVQNIQQEMVQFNGKLFGIYQGNKRALSVSEPEFIKIVLTKEFHRFTSKGFEKIFAEPVIHKMLAMIDDPDDWKRTRMVVSPSFSTGKLRKMQPLLDECTETMLTNIEKQTKQSKNEQIDVAKVSNAFTLDVVISVAFGTKVDSLNDKNNPLAAYSGTLLNKSFFFAVIFPRLSKLFGIEQTNSKAFAFYKNFATQLIEQRRSQKVKRNDFLQLMVDAQEDKTKDDVKDDEIDEVFKLDNIKLHNKTLSLDEIISQCVLFFVAGTETTAAGLTGTIYSLATNPETQEKLYEEVAPLFYVKDVKVDYDSIHSLKYLDAVLSEALRLYPPAPAIQRLAGEDCEIVFGSQTIKISKETEIRIPVYSMLHDPENFEHPEQFIPERFFPENKKHHPYAYLPFGGGPRSCVAQRLALFEAKLALVHWVYNYKTSCVTETKHPPKVTFTFGAMSPSNVILKVERRRK